MRDESAATAGLGRPYRRPATVVLAILCCTVEAAMLLISAIGLAAIALSVHALAGLGRSIAHSLQDSAVSRQHVAIDATSNLIAAVVLLLGAALLARRLWVGLVLQLAGVLIVAISYVRWCTRGQALTGLAFLIVAIVGAGLALAAPSLGWLRGRRADQ